MIRIFATTVATIWPFLLGSVLRAQEARPATLPAVPKISQRQFASGTAHLTVTGGFQVEADIAINIKASYGDGEVTWLQFGASGAAEPNALITYGEDHQAGINASKGKATAIGEGANCSGTAQATDKLVSGRYACKGVTSFDAGTRKMSLVDITIQFTAATAQP